LTKIAKKYGCSFEWLINGEGEPFPGRPIDPLRAALLDGSWPDVVVQAAQILASDGLKRDRSEWRKKLDAIAEVFETPAPPVSSRRPSN
jgi:hypothetical protein